MEFTVTHQTKCEENTPRWWPEKEMYYLLTCFIMMQFIIVMLQIHAINQKDLLFLVLNKKQ